MKCSFKMEFSGTTCDAETPDVVVPPEWDGTATTMVRCEMHRPTGYMTGKEWFEERLKARRKSAQNVPAPLPSTEEVREFLKDATGDPGPQGIPSGIPAKEKFIRDAAFARLTADLATSPGGVKFDAAKPRMDLLSTPALEGLALVLTYGAAKYEAHNWRKGLDWSRLTAAALRHLLAFQGGEDIDPESGLPHVDHALCCLMFLSEATKVPHGKDDRWKAGK